MVVIPCERTIAGSIFWCGVVERICVGADVVAVVPLQRIIMEEQCLNTYIKIMSSKVQPVDGKIIGSRFLRGKKH